MTKNVQFPCLWTDLNNFFFIDLEIRWWFQIRYCTLPQWLTGPQKFVIIIRCQINFYIKWYSVILAANLYMSIFVWSSFDIFNIIFMNVVILVVHLSYPSLVELHVLFKEEHNSYSSLWTFPIRDCAIFVYWVDLEFVCIQFGSLSSFQLWLMHSHLISILCSSQ